MAALYTDARVEDSFIDDGKPLRIVKSVSDTCWSQLQEINFPQSLDFTTVEGKGEQDGEMKQRGSANLYNPCKVQRVHTLLFRLESFLLNWGPFV